MNEETYELYFENIFKGIVVNQSLISMCLYKLGIKDNELQKIISELYKKVNQEFEKGEE